MQGPAELEAGVFEPPVAPQGNAARLDIPNAPQRPSSLPRLPLGAAERGGQLARCVGQFHASYDAYEEASRDAQESEEALGELGEPGEPMSTAVRTQLQRHLARVAALCAAAGDVVTNCTHVANAEIDAGVDLGYSEMLGREMENLRNLHDYHAFLRSYDPARRGGD
jgi:hypothetical protein